MALKLDKENAMIGGVCAGIANEMGWDMQIVRICFLLAFLLWGIGPIAYLVLWLIMHLTGKDGK